MPSVAHDLVWPTDPEILARVVFLHVGQGASTIVLAADGATYMSLLVDIHLDQNLGGIDVPRLMSDLLDGAALDVFVNSHPHNDHTCGIEKLLDTVSISAVWHSGHIPSKEHEGAYAELQRVIEKVADAGGETEELCGSRTAREIGEAECYILAPAQHVKDAIGDETTEGRDRRIHEHCAVLRVGGGDTWALLAGGERLAATVDAAGVGTLAVRLPGTVRILLWHHDDIWWDDGRIAIDLEVIGASAHGGATIWRLDHEHANTHTAWHACGAPDDPTPAQVAAIRAAGVLRGESLGATSGDGTIHIGIDLPRYGVALVEVTMAQ